MQPTATPTIAVPRPAGDPSLGVWQTVGFTFTCIYLFALFGRTPEIAAATIGSSLYQVGVFTILLVPLFMFGGGLTRLFQTRIAVLMVLLHAWILLTLPFSYWKGGSLSASLVLLRYAPSFVFVGGMVATTRQYSKAMATLAASVVADLLWILLSSDSKAEERLEGLASSRFANTNEIAIYALTGIPFLVFVMLNRRLMGLYRFIAGSAIMVALVMILRTGSRGGFITLAVMFLLTWLGSSVANKLKLAVAGCVLAVVVIASIPANIRQRLTSFTTEKKADDPTGAIGSFVTRSYLLQQSIEITLTHPLTGVGLGVYGAEAAEESKKNGQPVLWQVTHNMYTQVSAESGIPALILYLTILFLCLKEPYRIYKLCKDQPQWRELALMSACVIVAVTGFCVNGIFASIAFDFYFYVLVGFVIALSSVARRELGATATTSNQFRAPSGFATVRIPVPAATAEPGLTPTPAGSGFRPVPSRPRYALRNRALP